MDYEIKNISLSSVLKISFLVSLTVICIIAFFLYLTIIWVISLFGESITDLPLFDVIEAPTFNIFGVFFTSIINGLLLTGVLLFIVLLVAIFYNIYAKLVGGIHLDIKEKKTETDLTGSESTDEKC